MANPIAPLDPEQTATAEQQAAGEHYPVRALVALDQDVATDLGDQVPDETISAWCARLATTKQGLPRLIGVGMSKFLNLFQKDHGAKAQAGDYERAENVAATEAASGDIDPEKPE